MELLFSFGWLAIVVWLIARAVNQRGLLPSLARVDPPNSANAPRITVIIPARDEEANIGACLQALLAQDYPADRLHVVVVDDHSTDATPAIMRRVALCDTRVVPVASPPLPSRWVGKSHACWIGARALDGEVPGEVEWLCFIDADVRLQPGCLSSAVAAAQTQRLDLLSLTPRQELRTFAERLILPCGLILLSFLQDLRRVQGGRGPDVTATGQFMLVRRDAYEAAGGHAAVCRAICEDLEFARRLKRSGRSVLLMGGEALLSTRMYTGWRTLWPGLAKNLIDTLGGRSATLSIAFAAVLLAWAALLVPLLDFAGLAPHAGGGFIALVVALIGSGAIFGLHIAATVYFRIPFWYGLLFPLAYTVGAMMALDSVRRRASGRVSWKGRIYS